MEDPDKYIAKDVSRGTIKSLHHASLWECEFLKRIHLLLRKKQFRKEFSLSRIFIVNVDIGYLFQKIMSQK